MIDLYFLLKLFIYLVVILNVIALMIMFWEIISGSFQRFIEMRRTHIGRFERIEKEIRGLKDGDEN